MARTPKSLVQFEPTVYTYPGSVSRGYFGSYPSERGLDGNNLGRREVWIDWIRSLSNSDFDRAIRQDFDESFDSDLMQSLLEEHGVFVEPFFIHCIRDCIVRRFAERGLDLDDLRSKISAAWGREVHIPGKQNAIYFISQHIYEQTFLRLITTADASQMLSAWFDRYSLVQKCRLCSNDFRVIDLPNWVYFGSNGVKGCCFSCSIMETPRKATLFDLVPRFVESCGFIPNSNFGPRQHSFMSRLSDDQWVETLTLLARMGGVDHVKKKFGSWFKALAETGALPNGVRATARGVRCVATDGHECHSLDEQAIDNWLSSRQITHEREPLYPFHADLNPHEKRRADWKVGDTFVEYFGLFGDKGYDKKSSEKIMLAAQCGIDLITIYPSDLRRLEETLGSLLKD